MPSDDLGARIRIASRSCPGAVSGQVFRSPAQAFADLARSCAELGIEEWDFYGESGPVGRLGAELAGLFGVEAAAFFPTGIMAQQVASAGWRCRTSATCCFTRKMARGCCTAWRSAS